MSTRTTHHGIEEPLLPALGKVLRRAVVDHARGEERRAFRPVLHVGFPGGDQRTLELREGWRLDQALRVDMIEAITRGHLDQGRVPLLWLTRADGEEATTGEDLAWAAAARAAGTELGVALDLVVVTRHSWHDPRTGVGRAWRRARDRAGGPG